MPTELSSACYSIYMGTHSHKCIPFSLFLSCDDATLSVTCWHERCQCSLHPLSRLSAVFFPSANSINFSIRPWQSVTTPCNVDWSSKSSLLHVYTCRIFLDSYVASVYPAEFCVFNLSLATTIDPLYGYFVKSYTCNFGHSRWHRKVKIHPQFLLPLSKVSHRVCISVPPALLSSSLTVLATSSKFIGDQLWSNNPLLCLVSLPDLLRECDCWHHQQLME